MGKLGLFGLTVMALLLLTPVAYAKASEPEPPTNSRWRFGVEASGTMPISDTTKMTSAGFGLSMFAEHEIKEFGLSIEYVALGKKTWEDVEGELPRVFTTSFDNVNAQIYMFRRFQSGLYGIAGVGCGYGNISNNSGFDSHSFAVMWTSGIGYSFNNNFGVILKGTGTWGKAHNFDKELLRGDALYYLSLGVQYRF